MIEQTKHENQTMMDSPSNPFVSVIIPVFNDSERLKICLEALENQTYPKTLYEVIVVDNGSDKDQNIKEVVAQFSHGIATYEGTPGSYAARNKGISLAKGEVIAFTDADCIPAPDWIEKGVKTLLQVPNCGMVAGKIEIFVRNPNQLTIVELYEKATSFQQKKYIEKHKFGTTANVFTFKDVIERVGLFDGNLKSSGDFEWGRRVASLGYPQIYADEACVAHPARYSFAQLYKKSIRVAGGIYEGQIQKCDSLLDKNKLFLRLIAEYFTCPFWSAYDIFIDSSLKRVDNKLKVYCIMSVVRYIWAFEIIRLKFGGTVSRK
jgi:glycosyltransferase involved in cell wall biosynthesis